MAAKVGKYHLHETLGEGAYGKVKLGIHEDTKEEAAVKILSKDGIQAMDMTVNVRREIAIMKALKHKNIVNLLQVLTTSNRIYIVMELVSGGELFTKILSEGKLNESLARKYFQEMVDGVEYCHRRGVFHRDLKPENLLIDERTGCLKITDFGLSAMKQGDLLHTQVGSPNYCAPEVIARAKEGYDGAKVDAWSCGIVLFALCAGYLPFFDEDTKNLFKMILRSDVKYPKDFPPGARDICEKLLVKNPTGRSSLTEIKKHPWFLIDYKGDDSENRKRGGPKTKRSLQFFEPASGNTVYEEGVESATSHVTSTGSDFKHRASEASDVVSQREFIPVGSCDGVYPGKPVEELNLTQRIERVVGRYKTAFQLQHTHSMIASKSFKRDSSAKSREEDRSLLSRAKLITGTWAVKLAQQLLVHDDDDDLEVALEEIAAFEEMMDIWEQRAKDSHNSARWWESTGDFHGRESTLVMILLKVLEQKQAESALSDGSLSKTGADLQLSCSLSDHDGDNGASTIDETRSPNRRRWTIPKRPTDVGGFVVPRSRAESECRPEEEKADRKNKEPQPISSYFKIFGIIPTNGSLSFETSANPPKAIKVVGMTLMDQGAQVMMKRGENKLKCEKMINGNCLTISIVADEYQGKTVVSMRKGRGGRFDKEFEEIYNSIVDKFEE